MLRKLLAVAALVMSAGTANAITLDFSTAPEYAGDLASNFNQNGYTIAGPVFAGGTGFPTHGLAHMEQCCGPFVHDLDIMRMGGGTFDAVSFDIVWHDWGYIVETTPFNFVDYVYPDVRVSTSNGSVTFIGANFAGSTYTIGSLGANTSFLRIEAIAPSPFPPGVQLSGDQHFALDNVVVETIPLPASALLLGTALIGLMRLRRT